MKILNSILFSLLFACGFGADFTLKTSVHDTEFDWTRGDSYEGGKAPGGSGDEVIIPSNVTAKVTAADGDASFELVNSLYRIKPMAGAKLQVAVHGENVTNTLECIVSSHDSYPTQEKPAGMLEKIGGGTLILGNGSDRICPDAYYCCDYAVDLTVSQGAMILPQNRKNGTSLVVGVVHIAESASLMLSSPANFQVYSYGLSGAGTVFYPNEEKDAGKTQYSIFNVYFAKGIEKSVFSGAISGFVRIIVRHPAVLDLTGNGSDFSGSPVVTGRLGVMHFGNVNDSVSTIGTGNVNFSGTGGVVEYLGTEPETTDKPFWWTGYGTVDAGVFGGVTFTKKFSNTGGGQYVLHLTGSNTSECVLANPFISVYNEDGSLKGTPCVKKTGSGTWRMADSDGRDMHSVICVEDGTLKFDSIAERGELCSLGYSDALRECSYGAFADLADVDYAFLLGGDSTTGTLEYSGTAASGNATRKLAIRSKGRFVSDSATFGLEDVFSLGAGTKTLVLAGNSQHANYATDLSDGIDEDSRLAVDKEGAGTWDLVLPTSFSGPLTSHGGVLRVANRSKFRWYRICFTENGYGSSRYDSTYSVGKNDDGSPKTQTDSEKANVQLLELALYDKDGVNLLSGFATGEPGNANIPQYEFDGNYILQPAGTVAIGSTAYVPKFNEINGQLFNLFDNKNTKMSGNTTQSATGITIDNPSSWMVLTVRLPEDAPEAVRIDFMSAIATNAVAGTYHGRILTAFRLDGSVDGINWEVGIAQENALVAPAAGAKWYSDPEAAATTYGTRPGKGYEIARTSPSGSLGHAFTSVGAANGGVVDIVGSPYTVCGLVVDAAASAGFVSNVVFAAEGCIDVVNVDSLDFDSLDLPGDYSHIAGCGNLSRWKLRINGEENVRMTVESAGGKLTLKRRGFKIIVR